MNKQSEERTTQYFVHLYNDFSGSPRVLKEMINAVSGEIHLITSDGNGVLTNIDDVKYNTFRYTPHSNKIVKLCQFAIANIKIFSILLRLLNANKGSHQHVIVNTMLPFGALFAAKISGVKITAYIHETSIKPRLLKQFLRFCINKFASNAIFVSNYLFETEKFSNVPVQNILFNPLSNSLVSSWAEINVEEKFNERNVLFLSSLAFYKGLEDYLAIAGIAQERGVNINFHMVLNCTESQFKLFLKKNDIPQNVIMYNRPKNLKKLYLMSSFVLNLSTPYWVETFGLTLVEGMANGAVPIGPVIGGPAEIINHHFGFVIPHNEHLLILNTILTLLEDKEKFEAYSRNARIESEKYFFEQYKLKVQTLLK